LEVLCLALCRSVSDRDSSTNFRELLELDEGSSSWSFGLLAAVRETSGLLSRLLLGLRYVDFLPSDFRFLTFGLVSVFDSEASEFLFDL